MVVAAGNDGGGYLWFVFKEASDNGGFPLLECREKKEEEYSISNCH